MTEPAPTNLVVIADLPCRRCDYPLQGLAAGGRCPECGLPIEETIRHALDLTTVDQTPSSDPRIRRSVWGIPLLAIAAAIATAAGVALPAAVTLAPAGFDPRGLSGSDDLTRTRLDAALVWAGVSALTAGVLALTATLAGGRRSDARRADRLAILSGIALVASGAIALLPGGLGLEAAATSAARGLGGLIRGGGATPAPLVLVALAFDAVRAIAVAFLIIGVGDALQQFGRRSESYTIAGQGLQTARPVVAATIAVLLMEAGWLWSTLADGLGGIAGRALDLVAWPMLWLVAAAITALGGAYLAVNALWAVGSTRRPLRPLDALIGPASSASMADDPRPNRAP